MAASCWSGGGYCTRALSRPLRRWRPSGGPRGLLGEAQTRSDAWRTMPCGARGGTNLSPTAGRPVPEPPTAPELATVLGESALQGEASYYLGMAYFTIGDFAQAAELLRWSVEAADRESDAPRTDWRIRSQAWLARTLSALGAFAEGRRHGEEALHLATLEGRGHTPIAARGCLGLLYLAQGDLEHAIRVFDQGLALCRASGERAWSRVIVA